MGATGDEDGVSVLDIDKLERALAGTLDGQEAVGIRAEEHALTSSEVGLGGRPVGRGVERGGADRHDSIVAENPNRNVPVAVVGDLIDSENGGNPVAAKTERNIAGTAKGDLAVADALHAATGKNVLGELPSRVERPSLRGRLSAGVARLERAALMNVVHVGDNSHCPLLSQKSVSIRTGRNHPCCRFSQF